MIWEEADRLSETDQPEGTPPPLSLFRPPTAAVPLRSRGAWVVFSLVSVVALLSTAFVHAGPIWPTPDPLLTIFALAALAAVANNFGVFRTVDGLAEITTLALPISFATLLIVDWRQYVISVAVGEFFTFVSEFSRKKNPTIWYVRFFNVFALVVCGAASVFVLDVIGPALRIYGATSWLDGGLAMLLLLASVVWKVLDNVQSSAIVSLETTNRLPSFSLSMRSFLSQFALFIIAIPFARLWSENILLSLFALAPLGIAYRLLSVPELEARVRTDERTGLTNAVAFDRALEEALDRAREFGRGAALLAIDIDHFKNVNDTYGHVAGDAVIARFAEILTGVVRRDDIAARVGGEEFSILIGGGDRLAAMTFAERVRELIQAEPFAVDGVDTPIAITASIGVAVFPADARLPRDLRKAADTALYEAKRNGRNAVRTVASIS